MAGREAFKMGWASMKESMGQTCIQVCSSCMLRSHAFAASYTFVLCAGRTQVCGAKAECFVQ